MQKEYIHQLIENQRAYFYSGTTLSLEFRITALKKIQNYVKDHEDFINNALKMDLGKNRFESYMCETGMLLSEISYLLKHIQKFTKPKAVRTPLAQFHAKSYQLPSPYGVTLIMSPWNYPFLLTLEPLVDALAAGNTAIIKPSAYSPHTSEFITEMIRSLFAPEYVAVVTGGREENSYLLQEHFDYIFFTGSQTVGREVMKQASLHLTPVTLELGGKSPCIVEKSADLKLAARRIVFGKFLNCGQTCVAPDYILCDTTIREDLIEALKKEIIRQYGKSPLSNKNYGKIINEKHFQRIQSLIDPEKLVFGGDSNPDSLQIAPTILTSVTFEDAVMREEIFGPVLPILIYSSIESAIDIINHKPHPLALYLFTSDAAIKELVMSQCSFGGGCVNDTIIHLATSEMSFGGFGESGMGSYHGKQGFDTFTHYKSIVDKKTWIDLPIRYQPYRFLHEKLVHKFMH